MGTRSFPPRCLTNGSLPGAWLGPQQPAGWISLGLRRRCSMAVTAPDDDVSSAGLLASQPEWSLMQLTPVAMAKRVVRAAVG